MKQNELLTQDNLRVFGKEYRDILIKELVRAGKKASSKLIYSVDYRLTNETKEIQMYLDSLDYLEFVDKGRKPGRYPSIKAISNWAKLKGISQDAVFPIARKIYRFGIKPTNVINKTIIKIENTATQYEEVIVRNVEDAVYEQALKLTK